MVDEAGPGSAEDLRGAPRFEIGVPVEAKSGVGVTRDLSTSGVYFTCEHGMPLGSRISLTIVLDRANPSHRLRLHCHGEVVRLEEVGESVGIAVKIEEYTVQN